VTLKRCWESAFIWRSSCKGDHVEEVVVMDGMGWDGDGETEIVGGVQPQHVSRKQMIMFF
jgi:hypothetical protein